jgi:hypothetical protein
VLTIARATRLPTDDSVTVVAGQLPLLSWRSVLRVLVWTDRVRRSLADAPGLVGYQFGYDVGASTLWLASGWSTRTALIHFERGDAHCAAIARLRPLLRPSTFVVWTADPAKLPLGWDDIQRRIRAVQNR